VLAAEVPGEFPYLIVAVPASVALAALTTLGYIAKKRAARAKVQKNEAE
jgi:hypothetical protein